MEKIILKKKELIHYNICHYLSIESKKIHKFKRIKKNKKLNTHNSKISDSQETNFQSPTKMINNMKILLPQDSIRSVYMLLRDLIVKANFKMDTYLASLKVLKKMNFHLCQNMCKIVAASILLIVGKVHEFRCPKYKDLHNWSQNTLQKTELLKIQAQIWQGINFEVPLINQFQSECAILQQIHNYEHFFTFF